MIGLIEADLQEVIQPLIAALADSNPFVPGTAALVLADYGQKAAEVLPHLERLLADDEFIRVTAVYAVMCIAPGRTEELTPMLSEALSNGDKTVRQHAAQVLGDTPAAGALAIHFLIKALDDVDETVRLIVLNTRVYFRLKIAGAIWEISGLADHLLAIGSIAITSPEWWLRWQGAGALGELGSAGSVTIPQLRRLADDEHELVRRSAAESLGKIEAVA